MRPITIYKVTHTYASHPCVTNLSNGEWLVAFAASTQRHPYLHPPEDPHFMNFITRSRDQGQSWEPPQVAPNYGWTGVETPGLRQLSTGDLLLNQWRFRWYPLGLARQLWRSGEEKIFICDASGRHWRPVQQEADWADHPFAWARADDGAYVQISRDNGHTWTETVPVDIAPYQGAFSPKGCIELANGDLLLALGSHDYDPLHTSFIVRSTDKGRSWQKPVAAAHQAGRVFSEPSVAETPSGKLLLMSREAVTGYVHQSESPDGGHTWRPVRQLPFWGYPTHCIRLHDGRMLIVYGRRKEPFGIRAAVSADEGQSWSDEIILRDDLAPTYQGHNLGYPSVIEYAPGKLFTAYYGEDTDGVTCIQGSYFTL